MGYEEAKETIVAIETEFILDHLYEYYTDDWELYEEICEETPDLPLLEDGEIESILDEVLADLEKSFRKRISSNLSAYGTLQKTMDLLNDNHKQD